MNALHKMAKAQSASDKHFIRQTWITRDDLRANRDLVYVFGDNAAREGQRGLARQMRGEPNAHAISISWGPHEPFSLITSEAAIARIEQDVAALAARQTTLIVWPLFGIIPEFQSIPEELRLYLRRIVHQKFSLSDPV